jgi:hypothetical protein
VSCDPSYRGSVCDKLCLLLPAGIGAGFYLGYSWLPSFFTKHAIQRFSSFTYILLRFFIIFYKLCLLLLAGIGAGFYLGYSWLPSFFTKHAGIPQPLTLWMVLSGMVIFTFVVPVSNSVMPHCYNINLL